MSLLMFDLTPDGVWIVTDTLATKLHGEPHLLVSKCFAVPHLELAVTFTGLANAGQEWTQWVQSRVLAADIDMLDMHAPESLQFMYAELDIPDGLTSTIYHLGYSPAQEAYVGYVYRSANDFASEVMEPSFRVKPDPPDGFQAPGSAEEIIELAEAMREKQNAMPAEERIYIGGELVLTQLRSNTILSTKIHRFADFDEQWLEMNENLNREE